MNRTRTRVSRRLVLSLPALALANPKEGLAEAGSSEPLASWNNGPAKTAIVAFVRRVTTQGGPDYVPPAERVATFDNDGTLWAERPIYFQFEFAIDQVKALAPRRPEWKSTQPFAAVIAGDEKALTTLSERDVLQIIAATHAGVTTDEFAKTVAGWLASARHPRFGRPYSDLFYQPMVELLGHLRDNGFKTFIVSGGGVEFMRVFAERLYGIPPEQVIGSYGESEYGVRDGKPTLVKLAKVAFVDDGPGKPIAINRFVGRRPILAFGNSDGDREMLEWTTGASGTSLAGLVHHTDATREWAYDRGSPVGQLDKALDEAKVRGWVVVDIKSDWKKIFPFES